jgi:hypothetical protein
MIEHLLAIVVLKELLVPGEHTMHGDGGGTRRRGRAC